MTACALRAVTHGYDDLDLVFQKIVAGIRCKLRDDIAVVLKSLYYDMAVRGRDKFCCL